MFKGYLYFLYTVGILFLTVPLTLIFAQPHERLLGGSNVVGNLFRHCASVRLDKAHICGGSIIGERAILTAAHCLMEKGLKVSAERISVRVGSTNLYNGGQLMSVKEVIIHPAYKGVQNNLAILRLATSLEWSDNIRNISLYLPTDPPLANKTSLHVAGWGQNLNQSLSHQLQSLKLLTASNEICKEVYSDYNETTMCLQHELNRGICSGDGGNGAVKGDKLVAVSNFVLGSCGSRYPDVFTTVSYYTDWLQKFI